MGQLRSKSGTGKHFVYIPGNGAKRQLISVRVDVHYQGTGGYRSPRAGFLSQNNSEFSIRQQKWYNNSTEHDMTAFRGVAINLSRELSGF